MAIERSNRLSISRIEEFGQKPARLNGYSPEELIESERRYISSNAYETDRLYWLERFARWPGPLLEGDRERSERARSGCHARISFTLAHAKFSRLELQPWRWALRFLEQSLL